MTVSTEDGRSVFTWSSPPLLFPSPLITVPGRCHSAVAVGAGTDAVMCFGGGASNSNGFFVIRLTNYANSNAAPSSSSSAIHPDSDSGMNDSGSLNEPVITVPAPQLYGITQPSSTSTRRYPLTRTATREQPALPFSRLSATAVRVGKTDETSNNQSLSYL